MSQPLAHLIRQQLDELAQDYQRRLVAIGGGYERTTPERLAQIARHDLELIVQSLETKDTSPWPNWIRERLATRLDTDFELETLLQAALALEDTLWPQIEDLEDGRFLRQIMRQAQTAIIELTSQRWRESESKFRQLVERAPVGIFRAAMDGQIIEANPATLEITGYDSLEAIAQVGIPDLYEDPADRRRLLSLLKRGAVSGFETHIRRADDQVIPVSLSIRLVETNEGQFLEGIVQDITAQKRLQEQLVESERKFRQIVSHALVGIYRTTPDGQIIEANPTILDMLGFESLEQAQRTGLGNIYVDINDRQRFLAELQQGPVSSFETRFVHTDGHILDVSLSANLIYDQEGQPQYLEGTVEDITERKRVKQELENQSAFLRQVIDLNPHLIFAKDRQGRYTLVNEALARLYDTTIQDLLGKTDADINPNIEQVEQFRHEDLTVMNSLQEAIIPEEVITDAAGRTHWFQTIKQPLVGEDGIANQVLGIGTDITARKQLELERQETYERRAHQVQLSTEIAHEIAVAPTLDEMFRRVVTLVQERLDYYHVQIFRYVSALEAVLLVSSSGKIGEQMLKDGYRVDLERGVVGSAAATGQPVLVGDVNQAPRWKPNPYLPDTQGQLALPIILRREHEGELRDEMMGILDVHSDTAGALTTEIQLALQGLCDRLAIAIESVRLRQETEARLQELDALYRATTREGWQTVATEALAYRFAPLTSTLESLTPAEPTSELDFQEDFISVPLMLRGEAIGSVDIYDDPQAALSPEDIALVQSAAEQATQALERARLFEQTQITLTQTEMLYNAGRRLSAAEDLQEVLAAVIEGVPIAAVNRATLFHYEHDQAGEIENALVGANWYSGQGAPPAPVGQRYPWKALSDTMDVVFKVEPVFFDDVQNDERVSAMMLEVTKQQNVRALAMLPLWVGARQLGALLLAAEEPHHFSEHEIQPYLSLVGQMAVAIDNRNLFQQTQEALAERQALYRASSELNTARSYDDILATLREHTILGAGSIAISLQFFDRPWTDRRQPEWLEVLARWAQIPQENLLSRYPLNMFSSAFERLRPDAAGLLEDIVNDPNLDDNSRTFLVDVIGAKSTLFIPLVVAGQWIGLINSYYDEPTRFPEDELRRVMTLAGQAAVAAQSLRQLEDVQARAESEQLLRQVVATINASQNVVTDLPAIAQQLSTLAPIDALSLAAYTPGNPDYNLFSVDLQAEDAAAPQGIRHLLRGTAPGWVITNQQARLETDIRQGKPFSDDKQLIAQGIVSRLLLPLWAGGQVTGSLNLSSTQLGAFTQEHLRTLTPVADQVALALERASLLAETQAALGEVGATHRRYLGEEWESILTAIPDRVWGYWDGPEGIVETEEIWTPEIEQAVTSGELTTTVEDQPLTRSALAIPISLRGQTIGVLDFYHEGEARVWTEDDKALVTALAAQVGLALEGQRLFEQIQRRGSRERLTTEVVDKIRAAGDIQSILETATQELGRALGVSRALIRLGDPDDHSRNATP
jgi:PAS domain S-box-containing protein